jgi:hypothetical protein
MKLIKLLAEYWEVIGNYPNAILKPKKKKRLSFLTHPEDREKFLKWSNGKKK